MRWCCISHAEQKKCEQWALSIKSDPLVCIRAVSMRDCIEKIKVRHTNSRISGFLSDSEKYCYKSSCDLCLQKDEVDAVSLDATHSFIAGKCGLVPVVTEYYGKTLFMSVYSKVSHHSTHTQQRSYTKITSPFCIHYGLLVFILIL